jgi:hypothetical protein
VRSGRLAVHARPVYHFPNVHSNAELTSLLHGEPVGHRPPSEIAQLNAIEAAFEVLAAAEATYHPA